MRRGIGRAPVSGMHKPTGHEQPHGDSSRRVALSALPVAKGHCIKGGTPYGDLASSRAGSASLCMYAL